MKGECYTQLQDSRNMLHAAGSAAFPRARARLVNVLFVNARIRTLFQPVGRNLHGFIRKKYTDREVIMSRGIGVQRSFDCKSAIRMLIRMTRRCVAKEALR